MFLAVFCICQIISMLYYANVCVRISKYFECYYKNNMVVLQLFDYLTKSIVNLSSIIDMQLGIL